MDLLLSIIVPIYNKEKFLETCLNSVIDSYKSNDFEIILVDDGSTDRSGSIAERFAESNNNVICFHTQNGGVSAARNKGIKEAKGEYIAFVDADDEVIPKSFEEVLKKRDSNTDIFICGAVWGDGDVSICDLTYDCLVQGDEKDCFKSFLTGGAYSGDAVQKSARKYMWGVKEKFYKARFIHDNNILFDERLSRNEDVLFSLECYYKAKTITFIPLNVYINKIDPNGLTRSMNMEKNLYNFGIFFDLFKEKDFQVNEKERALFCFQNTLTLIREGYLSFTHRNNTFREYRGLMLTWFERDDIKRMLQYIPKEKLSKAKRFAFCLLKKKLFFLVGFEMDVYTRLKEKNISI